MVVPRFPASFPLFGGAYNPAISSLDRAVLCKLPLKSRYFPPSPWLSHSIGGASQVSGASSPLDPSGARAFRTGLRVEF
jgi:hypothetical protein